MAKEFTMDQVMRAQSALRAAAHMPQEKLSCAEFVQTITEEMQTLHEHGVKDAQIAFLIHAASGIEISESTLRAGRKAGKP